MIGDWIYDRTEGLLLALGALCLAFIAYAIYDDAVAVKFELRKDSWHCSASHTEYINTWISDGKGGGYSVITPTTVCDQWSRNA